MLECRAGGVLLNTLELDVRSLLSTRLLVPIKLQMSSLLSLRLLAPMKLRMPLRLSLWLLGLWLLGLWLLALIKVQLFSLLRWLGISLLHLGLADWRPCRPSGLGRHDLMACWIVVVWIGGGVWVVVVVGRLIVMSLVEISLAVMSLVVGLVVICLGVLSLLVIRLVVVMGLVEVAILGGGRLASYRRGGIYLTGAV